MARLPVAPPNTPVKTIRVRESPGSFSPISCPNPHLIDWTLLDRKGSGEVTGIVLVVSSGNHVVPASSPKLSIKGPHAALSAAAVPKLAVPSERYTLPPL